MIETKKAKDKRQKQVCYVLPIVKYLLHMTCHVANSTRKTLIARLRCYTINHYYHYLVALVAVCHLVLPAYCVLVAAHYLLFVKGSVVANTVIMLMIVNYSYDVYHCH